MEKNRKGFTLIELLAVIVILAIIALIATPIVLNIINNSRNSAALRSAELYIDTVEKTIVEKQMDSQVNLSGNYEIREGNLYQDGKLKLEIKIQNNKPTGESLEIDTNGKISKATLIIGKYQFSYDGEEFINTNKVTLNGTSKVTLTNAINGTLTNFKIYGNSIQNGIPTPNNSVEIESVGDLDSSTNKYKIPILTKTLNRCKSNRLNTTTVYSGVTQTIDANGVVTLNGTSTNTSFPLYASTKSFFLPKGTYTFNANMEGKGKTADGKEIAFSFYIQEDDSGKATTLVTSTNNTKTFTTTRDWNCKMYVYINAKNVTLENVKYSPMLVEGKYTSENMPAFEPNKNDIITNIYLDEPLRKVGDYADYIDFKNQKVVRNVKKIIYTGNENWKFASSGLWGNHSYYIPKPKDSISYSKSYCNYLKNYNKKQTKDLENEFIIGSSSIVLANNNIATEDGNAFKTWLSGLTNKLYIIYPLATPTEESLKLLSIDIPSGNTTIEVATFTKPSKIELDYNSK